VLLELLDNLLLVGDGERGSVEDLAELGVLLENTLESLERLCGGVEGVGLRGGRVLPQLLAKALPQPLARISSSHHRQCAN
jgi:hypothetical protein